LQTSATARSYRATLIPDTVNFDEVEFQADQRLLPTVQLKASSAARAAADAHRVTNKRVLKVERLEGSDLVEVADPFEGC
jgi:hypothetical protein